MAGDTASFPAASPTRQAGIERGFGIMRIWLGSLVLAAISISTMAFADSRKDRSFQVLDRLRHERFSDLKWSPDGNFLAIVHRRAAISQPTSQLIAAEDRDQIWIWDNEAKGLTNLTNGAQDASGAWDPRWSPDGSKLAFLSTRGGFSNLWIWDRSDPRPRKVTEDGIDAGSGFYKASPSACRWIDEVDLLCAQVVEKDDASELSIGDASGRAVLYANSAWESALSGESSVSTIDSRKFRKPVRNIVIVSSKTGEKRQITKGRADVNVFRGGPPFWLSPDRMHFAAIQPEGGSWHPIADFAAGVVGEIGLYATDHSEQALDLFGMPDHVVISSIKWSPDGKHLSFFGFHEDELPELGAETLASSVARPSSRLTSPYSGRFFVLNLEERKVKEISLCDLYMGNDTRPPSHLWIGSERIAFFSRLRADVINGIDELNWRFISLGGDLKADEGLASLQGAVHQYFAGQMRVNTLENGSAVFVSRGQAMLLSPAGDLSPFAVNGKNVPADYIYSLFPERPLAVSTTADGETSFYALDSTNGTARGPFRAGPDWWLSAFGFSEVGHFASATNTDYISRLAVEYSDGDAETVMSLNGHFEQIQRPEQRKFQYKSLNGSDLVGVITYPPNYDSQKKYPVIFDSDIGYTPETVPSTFGADSNYLPDDHVLAFTSAGYIYVWLSMPVNELEPYGRANLLSYTSGILPGVEEVINMGIGDPNRLFLYGMSSMGHGVFGLITQTNRFTAAVSGIGFVDPARVGIQTQFVDRYSEETSHFLQHRATYMGLDLPTYFGNELHRRNSAMTYVDRVQTPVMIVAGDMRAGYLERMEGFFGALAQQGKPARLVRYWGEGHGNKNAANVRDYYARITHWFDEWGDISRDNDGDILFEGQTARSRGSDSQPSVEDYMRFPVFAEYASSE